VTSLILVPADAVATATVALAIVTLALAAVTAWGITSGRADARNQLAASYRPVVVPFMQAAESVRFRGGTIPAIRGPYIEENPADRPDLPTYSAAFLPVVNVGKGPALNVRGDFTGPRSQGRTEDATEAIAAGERGVVAFENATGQSLQYTGNDASVSATLEYDDVAGTTYRTHVTFDIGRNAYRSTLEVPDA
jgi:hypothetical protein